MMYFSVILIAMVISALPLRAGDAAEQNSPYVKIHILSKQMRQLSEGSLPRLSCIPPKGALILDELRDEKTPAETLVVTGANHEFNIAIGSRDIKCPFRIKIFTQGGQGVIKVKISGEERVYPLPLVIICEKGSPRFYVLERLERYIIDSASVEYGLEHQNEGEAVFALSHIILYRYYHALSSPRHTDAQFCDLTHCQLYRGRLKEKYRFNDKWLIDHEKPGDDLFFHSRCGGKTFGPEIFGLSGSPAMPLKTRWVRDRLWKDGIDLCRDGNSSWTRTITGDELHSILFGGRGDSISPEIVVNYKMDSLRIDISEGDNHISYAPESFRLKINRLKGWNFLKSNNFIVTPKLINAQKIFIFQGEGLGHGVGLCQHGAIRLSRLGYNRYEIIEHYYPDISLKASAGAFAYPPYFSYSVFDLTSGVLLASNREQNFLFRKMPPGSTYKLLIALFIAKTRPDIFNDYTYSCTGKNQHDAIMPGRCWKAGGHGTVGMQEAISNSCNLYFASLHKKISFIKFKKFINEFYPCLAIQAELPEITTDTQWAALLAGLDSRVTLSVPDFIKLVRFLNPDAPPKTETDCPSIPMQGRMMIYKSLTEVFTKGTASGALTHYGSPYNYLQLKEMKAEERGGPSSQELWGKTATVVEGTNRPVSYGLFIGGRGNTGIIAILRKGNGNMAARWARLLLLNEIHD